MQKQLNIRQISIRADTSATDKTRLETGVMYFVLILSACLYVTVTGVHGRCCEQRALRVVTQSLSSHLILTTTRVPRGRCVADQSQGDATMTKRPLLGCRQPRNGFSLGNGRVCVNMCEFNRL